MEMTEAMDGREIAALVRCRRIKIYWATRHLARGKGFATMKQDMHGFISSAVYIYILGF